MREWGSEEGEGRVMVLFSYLLSSRDFPQLQIMDLGLQWEKLTIRHRESVVFECFLHFLEKNYVGIQVIRQLPLEICCIVHCIITYILNK